jgi:hypothetical protein
VVCCVPYGLLLRTVRSGGRCTGGEWGGGGLVVHNVHAVGGGLVVHNVHAVKYKK